MRSLAVTTAGDEPEIVVMEVLDRFDREAEAEGSALKAAARAAPRAAAAAAKPIALRSTGDGQSGRSKVCYSVRERGDDLAEGRRLLGRGRSSKAGAKQ